jgi:AraC-like DNA-binding protein
MPTSVRCASLNGYVGLAKALQIDPALLMTTVGLEVTDLTTPDKWISAAKAARLLDISAAESGRDDFGLRLAELRRLSTLGPLSVVLREEPNLRAALQLLRRYEHSYNEALHTELSETDSLASIRVWLELSEPAPTRQALELVVGALVGIVRSILGEQWQPLSVCFSHRQPADLTTHHRLLGPRLQFSHQFTGLVLYATELDARNTGSDPLLRPYTEQFLESLGLTRASSTVDRVKELVDVLLPVGRCSTEQVSRSLGVDRRTLHRQLAAHGETFTSIVNTTRAGMAERYLANERYSVTEVSQLLGFAAPSAFSRWFRQQFGASPKDWRDASSRATALPTV